MEDRSFYVYAHYRLDTMEPFYIGKGKDGRKDVLSRNTIHDNISKKHGHAVVILYNNLTEKEAFFYEREVIEDLVFNEGYEIHCKNCGEFTRKFSYLTNFSFGGEGVSGHIHSEEERKKQSISIKKHWEDEEYKKKLSIIQKKSYEDPKIREKCGRPGEKHHYAKSVYCNQLNIIFSYIGLAEKYCINVLNFKANKIGYACNGKIKSSGRYNGEKLTWNWTSNIDKETLDNAEYIDSKCYEEIIKAKLNKNK